MKRVDVLMPTLGMQGTETVDALTEHAPFKFDLITSSVPGWSAAINDCLRRRTPGHDVLIIDDDVTVLPSTFDRLARYLKVADVIGFKLLFPDYNLQHGGGMVTMLGRTGHIMYQEDMPSYVAYVTASLCYIKEEVLGAVAPLNVWEGVQWEDVALCLDAWEAGYRVAYVPDPAIHKETATKKHDPKFWEKFEINAQAFYEKYERQCIKASTKFGTTRRLPIEPVP